MKFWKTVKNEIVASTNENKETTYYVNFVKTKYREIFGKIFKSTSIKTDAIVFKNLNDAKTYIENVYKPSAVSGEFSTYRKIYLKNKGKYGVRYLPFLSYNPWELDDPAETKYGTFTEAYKATKYKEKVVLTISETDSGYSVIDNQIKEINGKRNELISNEIERLEKTIQFLKSLNK